MANSRATPKPHVLAGGSAAHDPCSHVANGHRLANHFYDQLLYVKGIGWHTWGCDTWGGPWQLDELGARRIAQGLGRIIAAEAAELAAWTAAAETIDEREKRESEMNRRFKWAGMSESAPNIEYSLQMAAAHLSCDASEMDANPLLFGLPSSVLELDTGINRLHQPGDRLTKVAGCEFDPNAPAPRFERFIAEVMNNDAEMIAYLQCLFGYAMSGERGEHLLPFLLGGGANGKTTLLGTLQAAFGDYAGSAPPGLLVQKGGNEHPTSLASLQGLRFVVSSETGESGRLNEEQVKVLTGGDKISARRMRMDFYEFKPTHQLFLQSNHRPRVSGTDEGIWRRIRLIPFGVTVPAAQRDPHLPAKLQAELPGILAWCWRGWQRYRAEGFTTPAAVRLATSEYRDASDQVGAFLADECEMVAGIATPAGVLYRAYEAWAVANCERPRSQRDFGMRLTERGFEQARTAGERRWRGIRIPGDGCDGCDGGSGLIHTRDGLSKAHTESTVTSVTSVTHVDDYRAAKGRA